MIWNTAQYYLEPKAAIVSEGMGTGKTCICLALILSFKHQLANIDEVRGDSFGRISSRRTARSEAFPWVSNSNEAEDEEAINASLASGSAGMMVQGSRTLTKVPSLYDLTLDLVLCSTHHRALRLHEQRDAFVPTDADLPYVWEIPVPKGRDDTRSLSATRRKVYISATSLVVVPDILVAQWLAEIGKHVSEGALEYIKLERDDDIPSAEELCKLDLVLVSESKMRLEESRFWPAGMLFYITLTEGMPKTDLLVSCSLTYLSVSIHRKYP